MTKALIALSIAQTMLLVFLGLRVMQTDARIRDLTAQAPLQTAPAANNAPIENFPAQSASAPAATVRLDMEAFRQIIREELAAFEASRPAANAQSPAQTARPEAEIIAAQQVVDRDISAYIGQGRINEAQMADLQLKIARLPPDRRQEALNRLTRAMNDGALEGRF